MPFSLIDSVRKRYLEAIGGTSGRWKVLVVDPYTLKSINEVLTYQEITEQGVQYVDQIDRNRRPQPNTPAVYILQPTYQNVELVIRDYLGSDRDAMVEQMAEAHGGAKKMGKKGMQMSDLAAQLPATPLYKEAYIHFMEGLSDEFAERLDSVLSRTYMRALTELYINISPLETHVFSMKQPHIFQSLYGIPPPARAAKESVVHWEFDIGWMSRAIVNTLATIGEYPLIRYWNPPEKWPSRLLGPAEAAGVPLAQRLAERVQQDIDKYARENTDFPPQEDPPRPRGIVFITDRSVDLFTPLLHEFTYQALLHDLLTIPEDSKYSHSYRDAQGQRQRRDVHLNESDKVFLSIRHAHMKDALDKIVEDLRKFNQEQEKVTEADGAKLSVSDVRDMMASIPQMRESKELLALHLSLAEKCMDIFEKRQLGDIANVEQNCATGITAEGRAPKTVVEDMIPLLGDPSVTTLDKLRIISIYILHRDGVPEGDKQRLFQHTRLSFYEQDAVNNLACLGAQVVSSRGNARKRIFKHIDPPDAYDSSRYQPNIKYMIQEHFKNTLDSDIFPYVRDAPVDEDGTPTTSIPTSLRSARPQWSMTKAVRSNRDKKQRVLIFVAGGATFAEVRTAYELSQELNKDVILGTNHLFNPEGFAKALTNLSKNSSGMPMSASPFAGLKPKHSNGTPVGLVPLPQYVIDQRYAYEGMPVPAPPEPTKSKKKSKKSMENMQAAQAVQAGAPPPAAPLPAVSGGVSKLTKAKNAVIPGRSKQSMPGDPYAGNAGNAFQEQGPYAGAVDPYSERRVMSSSGYSYGDKSPPATSQSRMASVAPQPTSPSMNGYPAAFSPQQGYPMGYAQQDNAYPQNYAPQASSPQVYRQEYPAPPMGQYYPQQQPQQFAYATQQPAFQAVPSAPASKPKKNPVAKVFGKKQEPPQTIAEAMPAAMLNANSTGEFKPQKKGLFKRK